MTINRQELATGGIFVALGLFFGLSAYFDLPLGRALRMGPGFFPLLLSAILILLGIVIALKGARLPEPAITSIPWRGILFILPTPILAGATMRGLGLAPTLALVSLLASFASPRMTLPLALALSAGLTVFCVIVFHFGLGLPIPLFGPWTGPLDGFGG